MSRFSRLSLAPALLLALVACDSGPTGASDELPECTEALTLPSLEPGEAHRLTGGAARALCLAPAGGEGAEYVLVVHQASGSAADSLNLRVRSAGIRPPGSEPVPGGGAVVADAPGTSGGADAPPAPGAAARTAPEPAGASGSGTLLGSGDLPMDDAQHLRLRELERTELGPLVRWGAADLSAPAGHEHGSAAAASARPAPGAPGASPPSVGQFLEFNTQSQSACGNPIYRTGQVMAVSEKAIVVADTLNPNFGTSNPSQGFTAQDYQHFAASFDTLVVPLAEQAFGTGSDVSGDGRTVLFYTQEVNRLTAAGAGNVVLGFFFARDLFPRQPASGLDGCAESNEAEILYLLVPDPSGTVHQNARTAEFVRRRALATLIHEHQHLLNAGRRLHVVQTPNFQEEAWLNEGLSHIAEELLFFHVTGLGPGQDIHIDDIRGDQQILDAMNAHQGTNTSRLRRYLEAPSTNSPYDTQITLAMRGAVWNFLRYVIDRRGGDGHDLLRALVEGPSTGFQNLALVMGGPETAHEWVSDWSVALYADSRVEGIPDRFRDRSWNHFSIFPHLGENPPQGYPLLTRSISPAAPTTQVVRGGGSAYFRFGLAAGEDGLVELTRGGASPPASLRATLLRIR